MHIRHTEWPVRAAVWVHRQASRLCPPEFASWCGADLARAFRDRCEHIVRERGMTALAVVACCESWNVATVGVRERLRRSPASHRWQMADDPMTNDPRRPPMLIDDVRHAVKRLRGQPGTAVLAAC